MNKFIKSWRYGVISMLPSLFIMSIVYLLIFTPSSYAHLSFTSYQVYDRQIPYYKLFTLFDNYLWLFIALLVVLFIIAQSLYYIFYLKIINPNFKLVNFRNKKSYFSFLLYFVAFVIALSSIGAWVNSLLSSLQVAWLSYFVLASVLFAIFLFWHQDGYFGKVEKFSELKKVKFKEKIKLTFNKSNILFDKRLYIKILAVIFSFSAVFSISSYLSTAPINVLSFIPVETPFKYNSSFIFTITLGSFLYLPLIYLLSEKNKTPSIIFKTIPVILVTLAILLLGANYQKFKESKDLHKTIVTETGVETDRVINNTVVYFSPEVEVSSYEASATLFRNIEDNIAEDNLGLSGSSYFKLFNLHKQASNFESSDEARHFIGCNQENITKLENLSGNLEIKNFETTLSLDYFSVLKMCYRDNWEFNKYRSLIKKSFEKTNYVIDGLAYSRFVGAQIDENEIEEYKNFINSGLYRIVSGGHGKPLEHNIAKKFLHYGLEEEAIKWGSNDFDGIKTDFRGGIIKGELEIPEGMKIKIGLLIDDDKDGSFGLPLETDSNKRLVASVSPGETGQFIFDNLIEGEYYLAFLFLEEEFASEQIDILNELIRSKIELTKSSSNIDLGKITILIME